MTLTWRTTVLGQNNESNKELTKRIPQNEKLEPTKQFNIIVKSSLERWGIGYDFMRNYPH